MSPNLRQTEKKWLQTGSQFLNPMLEYFSSFFELTNLALAKMAKRLFRNARFYCVPSERSFSLSGPTVTNLRNHSETVRSAKYWLKQKNSKIIF